jgi:uncharacterized protein YukE
VPERIYADLAVLERGVENFAQVLKEYEDVLSSLDDHLRVSLAEWRGEARRAYRTFHHEWREQARDMAARLAWLRQVIASSHGNYGLSRSVNLKMWNP